MKPSPLHFLMGIAWALCTTGVAWAGAPTDQVKQTTGKILQVVTDPELKEPGKAAERRQQILAVADEQFDWAAMAQRSLGQDWRKRTDAERQEFAALFRQLIGNAYLGRIEGYSGEGIRYGDEEIDEQYATVAVVIITKKDVEIPIEYRLYRKRAEPEELWLVYDLKIEGVSLVNNYRTQFREELNRGSFEELRDKLKEKVAEGPGSAEGAP